MIPRALLLAAGEGTRLRPLTESVAKCLVPIGGRPLLDYWLARLAELGVHDALINTHALAAQVRRHIERVNRQGVIRLVEVYEPELLGSAGTISANPSLADDAECVVIVYPDNLSTAELTSLMEFHRSHDDEVTLMLFETAEPRSCGIASLDSENRIIAFEEKPRRPPGNLAWAGVCVVDPGSFREIASMAKKDLAAEVFPEFLGRMRAWIWRGYHVDIGTPASYERARSEWPEVSAGQRLAPVSAVHPAVFLDRDGTILEPVDYLSNPEEARLVPGVAEAIRRLRQAGFVIVVVTNQAGVGRGLFNEAMMHRVNAEVERRLRDSGATLDAIYACTAAPNSSSRLVVEHFERKPGPGMLYRAAADLGLDLGRSWMVGDMISDALAGRNAGCSGCFLVGTGLPLQGDEVQAATDFEQVSDLAEAAERILLRTAAGRSSAAGETACEVEGESDSCGL